MVKPFSLKAQSFSLSGRIILPSEGATVVPQRKISLPGQQPVYPKRKSLYPTQKPILYIQNRLLTLKKNKKHGRLCKRQRPAIRFADKNFSDKVTSATYAALFGLKAQPKLPPYRQMLNGLPM